MLSLPSLTYIMQVTHHASNTTVHTWQLRNRKAAVWMLVPRGNKPWHTLGEIEFGGRGPGRWAVGGGGDGSSIGSQVIPGFDVIGAPVSQRPVAS